MKDIKKLLALLHVKQGDITKEHVDAIVNAANPSLLGGGGVDGAIHRAAGPGLLEECRTLGGARPGEAKITRGYNLKAAYVIHTPGPVYKDGQHGESEILSHSYRNSMRLAMEHKLSSIAFPAISAGIYGYPKKDACKIAVDTVLYFMKDAGYAIDVYYIIFDKYNYTIYINYIDHIKSSA